MNEYNTVNDMKIIFKYVGYINVGHYKMFVQLRSKCRFWSK